MAARPCHKLQYPSKIREFFQGRRMIHCKGYCPGLIPVKRFRTNTLFLVRQFYQIKFFDKAQYV